MFRKSQHLSLFVLLFFSSFVSSQTKNDTIFKKSYEEISDLYVKAKSSEERVFYANIFLEKARKENNYYNLARGYHITSTLYSDEKSLQYIDSIILISESNKMENYPALGYLAKGHYYFLKRAYKKALDNYLLHSKIAQELGEERILFSSRFQIGNIKRTIGHFDEALDIYKENYSYAKKNLDSIDNESYLLSIISIANVYNDKKIADSSAYYNKLGFKESVRLKNTLYQSLFAANEGVTRFHKKEYVNAIDSFQKHIPYFEKINDLEELSFVYYFCGESYRLINNPKKALYYFKKVDTVFQKTQSLFPTLKDNYKRLRDYYKSKEDYKNEIVYLEKQQKVDSILFEDKIYLNGGIIKEYDIPKYKAEKENLLKKQKIKDRRFKNTIIFLSFLILILVFAFGFQYKRRKRYRKRFDDIINNKKPLQEISQETSNKKISVPEDIIENILKGLKIFEEKNGFTSNEVTLHYLAKKLHTNPNYLSKVINHYKEASFSNYLNNLRIDYTIDQLKTNPVYKKYTIKAISSEVGFNNVQSFAKAFHNSKGINPSYFIKRLNKTN